MYLFIVELWNKENITGYKTECYEGQARVVQIWCKICAKHKDRLLADLKGAAVNSASTEGTNNVAKHQILAVFFLFLSC